jgi:hypothetical protein
MPDYILLMHNDATAPLNVDDWGPYIAGLNAADALQGGSAIGEGVCLRKTGPAPGITSHVSGFMRIGAASLDEARGLVSGNPVFEAGGTVEIRELPRTE